MGRTNMMNIPQAPINLDTLKNIESFILVYHEDEDTLFVRPDNPRPATSLDWNGEVWIRIDLESGEVVGLEIDDFEGFFLKKHPELALAWQQVKPLCHRKKKDICEEPLWISFIKIITAFLLQLFRTTPQQSSYFTNA
jgi:hypothetical protein